MGLWRLSYFLVGGLAVITLSWLSLVSHLYIWIDVLIMYLWLLLLRVSLLAPKGGLVRHPGFGWSSGARHCRTVALGAATCPNGHASWT